MASNSHGSYQTTKIAMMKAYDKLPKSLREALANSDENWVPQPVLTRWRKLGWKDSILPLIKAVSIWDMQRRSSKSMARVWGPGHPQAIGATQGQIRKAQR